MGSELDFGVVFGMGECTEFHIDGVYLEFGFGSFPEMRVGDCVPLQKLCIWQQNINRSLEGQIDLLQSLKARNYDIVTIQEPHIDFAGRTRANPHWSVIYPKQHLINPKKTRSVTLVNHNISTNNWDAINTASYDITGVRMHGTFGLLCILNVYNDCGNNGSIEVMERVMKERGGGED